MVDVLEKKAELQKLPPARALFLKGVKCAQYQFIIWKSLSDIKPDKPTPDNYGWKRDCDKYISVMTSLPPASKAPLQLIKCGCAASLYAKHLGVRTKLAIYIVPLYVFVEQNRTHVK